MKTVELGEKKIMEKLIVCGLSLPIYSSTPGELLNFEQTQYIYFRIRNYDLLYVHWTF